MTKKMILAFVASVFLLLSAGASAEPVSAVFNCKLNDGMTKDDAMAINAKWLKWARSVGGSDEITSSFVLTVVGEFGGFLWVDNYPDLATWAKVSAAESPELDEGFDAVQTCSRNSIYQGEETVAAK
jgi:hypothetical protein